MPSTLCGWFPYAARLAKSGYRVLLFDERRSGDRLDLDVPAAVGEALALGARRVVAMGASRGGAATLIAAGRDCMLVSGVVSVSGETDLRSYGAGVPPLYAVPYERRIAAPLLVVGSRDDSLIGQGAVNTLVRRARHARAVLVPGGDHGWDMGAGPRRRPQDHGRDRRLPRARGPAGRDGLPGFLRSRVRSQGERGRVLDSASRRGPCCSRGRHVREVRRAAARAGPVLPRLRGPGGAG